MREKYVEERFNRWFVFGVHPSGNVDLSCADGDVFQDIDPATAAKLIAVRDEYVDALWRIFNADNQAFYNATGLAR